MWKGRTKMCDKKILIFLVLIKCTFYSEFHVNKVFKDQVTFPYLYAYLACILRTKTLKHNVFSALALFTGTLRQSKKVYSDAQKKYFSPFPRFSLS